MEKRNNQEILVREMKVEDIERVLAIDTKITGNDRAVTYSTLPRSDLGGELDISYVAEVGGQIVGFLLGRMGDSPDQAEGCFLLDMIGVDPDYRRQGIGRKLIQAFEEGCREKGACSIRVMVSWHDWWLLSFLSSMGFGHGEMAEFVKYVEP